MRCLSLCMMLLVGLPGCGTVFNGASQATTVAERHPITVDQQTVSMTVPVDPTLQGLPRNIHAELNAFLTAYRTRGHGPITVTAPSGSRRDRDAHQTAADVRQSLNDLGLAYADMQGATYRTTDAEPVVIVSFTRYVASAPVCGVYSGEVMSRWRNLAAPNFGCADQHNLAAMVADPRDLSRMTPSAPSNGTAAAAAVRALVTFDENGAPAGRRWRRRVKFKGHTSALGGRPFGTGVSACRVSL